MGSDVREWLEGLGLGKYAEIFAANDVDDRALPHLDREDLKELGVSLGHRKIILAAIAELNAQKNAVERPGIAATTCSMYRVMRSTSSWIGCRTPARRA